MHKPMSVDTLRLQETVFYIRRTEDCFAAVFAGLDRTKWSLVLVFFISFLYFFASGYVCQIKLTILGF